MVRVIIRMQGCDDNTSIEKDITQEQLNFLIELREEMNITREYECEPELVLITKQPEEGG